MDEIYKPFNDKHMKYDMASHMYVLTKEFMRDTYGVDLDATLDSKGDFNPSTLADRWLKRISLVLYEYIYSYSSDRECSMYLLAMREDFRDSLKTALGEFAFATLSNNIDYSIETGLNPNNGVVITEDFINTQGIPIGIKRILFSTGICTRNSFSGFFNRKVLKDKGVLY